MRRVGDLVPRLCERLGFLLDPCEAASKVSHVTIRVHMVLVMVRELQGSPRRRELLMNSRPILIDKESARLMVGCFRAKWSPI